MDVLDRLEALIEHQFEERKPAHEVLVDSGTPFISVGVLEKGNITARVIGSSKTTDSEQPGGDTLFQAASISKPITALAVLKLCQEGQLDLDSPISKFLSKEQISWLSTPQNASIVAQITLRQLLSHTSGLSVHGFDGYAKGPIPSVSQILRGEVPANNPPVKLSYLPGQKYSYSGGGVTVIQLILETKLGKPFEQIMRDLVLVPLGMSRSTYGILPVLEADYAAAYLTGTLPAYSKYHLQPEKAAAGLWTTPTDLLKAIKAVQCSLAMDDFLTRDWARIMLTEMEDGMALGWLAERNGNSFRHTGRNAPGYTCIVTGYANLRGEDHATDKSEEEENDPEGCGICVMTSSALGDETYPKVITAIQYLKGWPQNSEKVLIPFVDRSKSLDQSVQGWYGTWEPNSWNIKEADDGSPFLQLRDLAGVRLLPAAIPPRSYEQGESIDLVAEGLEVMIRLGWRYGSRIVEIWQDSDVVVLNRRAVHET